MYDIRKCTTRHARYRRNSSREKRAFLYTSKNVDWHEKRKCRQTPPFFFDRQKSRHLKTISPSFGINIHGNLKPIYTHHKYCTVRKPYRLRIACANIVHLTFTFGKPRDHHFRSAGTAGTGRSTTVRCNICRYVHVHAHHPHSSQQPTQSNATAIAQYM